MTHLVKTVMEFRMDLQPKMNVVFAVETDHHVEFQMLSNVQTAIENAPVLELFTTDDTLIPMIYMIKKQDHSWTLKKCMRWINIKLMNQLEAYNVNQNIFKILIVETIVDLYKVVGVDKTSHQFV